MAIHQFDASADVHEELAEDEQLWHSHQTPDASYAVTRQPDPEMDPDYDGEPIECPVCDETVDYFVCETCGDAFQTENGLKGHQNAHNED